MAADKDSRTSYRKEKNPVSPGLQKSIAHVILQLSFGEKPD